jgi:ATP-binding cassette subfamily B (MDR/TAP) protein 1
MSTIDDKHTSPDEEPHDPSSPREEFEKRQMNEPESPAVEMEVRDQEKAQLSQAPLPIGPGLPLDTSNFEKVDSRVVDVKNDDPFRHLPEEERAVLKRQIDVPEVKVGYFSLYRYATKIDILILIISTICTIAAGAAMPLMTVSYESSNNV